MTAPALWIAATTAFAGGWSVDVAGRLTAVGWTPSAEGGGLDVGAVATVAGGDRVRLAVGPRVTVDRTGLLGTPVAVLASADVLGCPTRHLGIDARLVGGVETSWGPPGWEVEEGGMIPVPATPSAPAARVGLSVGIGPVLATDRFTFRPFVRYEQAVILGFAPAAGVPVLLRASVGIGLAIDLPSPRPP